MDETVTYPGMRCTRQTPKAIFVSDDGDLAFWVPQSVVHDDSEVYQEGDYGDLVLKEWWVRKNNR